MRISETMINERDRWLGIVSEVTGVERDAIMGKSRVESAAMARHLLIWALHSLRGYTYPVIGELLGRNYATCIHINNVIEYTRHSKEWESNINRVKAHNNGCASITNP